MNYKTLFQAPAARLMSWLRKLLRRVPSAYALLRWRAFQAWWWLRGKPGQAPIPPPHVVKQWTVRRYARRYGLRVLVETGTFYGQMVRAQKAFFDRIYSIELSPQLHQRACEHFRAFPHIELILGDSGVELARVLRQLDQPALFWLDGHYSGGVTARGEQETPIQAELRHLLEAPDLGHVILIDDARHFGSKPGYPSVEELRQFVGARRPQVELTVRDDMIRITPPRRRPIASS